MTTKIDENIFSMPNDKEFDVERLLLKKAKLQERIDAIDALLAEAAAVGINIERE